MTASLLLSLGLGLAAGQNIAGPCSDRQVPAWKAAVPGLNPERSDFLWAYLALPEGTPYGGGVSEPSWKGYADDAQRCRALKDYIVRLGKHEETKTGHLAFIRGKSRPAGKPLDYDLKAALRELFMLRSWLNNFKGVRLADAWRRELDEGLKGFKTDLAAAKEAKRKLAAPAPLPKEAPAALGRTLKAPTEAFDGSAARSESTLAPSPAAASVPEAMPRPSELPEAGPGPAPEPAPAPSDDNKPEAVQAVGAGTAGLSGLVAASAGPVGWIAAVSGTLALLGAGVWVLGYGWRLYRTNAGKK